MDLDEDYSSTNTNLDCFCELQHLDLSKFITLSSILSSEAVLSVTTSNHIRPYEVSRQLLSADNPWEVTDSKLKQDSAEISSGLVVQWLTMSLPMLTSQKLANLSTRNAQLVQIADAINGKSFRTCDTSVSSADHLRNLFTSLKNPEFAILGFGSSSVALVEATAFVIRCRLVPRANMATAISAICA